MSDWFVYVIIEIGRDGKRTGYLKIGSASCPISRALQLNTGNPNKLAVAGVQSFETRTMAREIEQLAHRLCRGKVPYTEWFNCSVDDAQHAIQTAMAVHDDGQRACDFERYEDVYAGQA